MWTPNRNQFRDTSGQCSPETPPADPLSGGHVYASLDSFHLAPTAAADTPTPVRSRAGGGGGVLGSGGVLRDLRVCAKSLRRRRQTPPSMSGTLPHSFKPLPADSSSTAWPTSTMSSSSSPASSPIHQPLQQLSRLYREALLPLGMNQTQTDRVLILNLRFKITIM